MNPFKIPELVNQMSEKQPFVMVYLMGMGGDALNQEEREETLFIGTAIWQAMLQVAGEMPQVSEESLDEIEDLNMGILESLLDKPDKALEAASRAIIENHNQKEILGFVTELLEELREDDEAIRDEQVGLMFLILKMVVEAMDKTVE